MIDILLVFSTIFLPVFFGSCLFESLHQENLQYLKDMNIKRSKIITKQAEHTLCGGVGFFTKL